MMALRPEDLTHEKKEVGEIHIATALQQLVIRATEWLQYHHRWNRWERRVTITAFCTINDETWGRHFGEVCYQSFIFDLNPCHIRLARDITGTSPFKALELLERIHEQPSALESPEPVIFTRQHGLENKTPVLAPLSDPVFLQEIYGMEVGIRTMEIPAEFHTQCFDTPAHMVKGVLANRLAAFRFQRNNESHRPIPLETEFKT